MNMISRMLAVPYGETSFVLLIVWIGLSIPLNVYVICQLKKHIREKTDTEAIWSSIVVFYILQFVACLSVSCQLYILLK